MGLRRGCCARIAPATTSTTTILASATTNTNASNQPRLFPTFLPLAKAAPPRCRRVHQRGTRPAHPRPGGRTHAPRANEEPPRRLFLWIGLQTLGRCCDVQCNAVHRGGDNNSTMLTLAIPQTILLRNRDRIYYFHQLYTDRKSVV